MTVIRRISRNGNSVWVSLPAAMLELLQRRPGDAVAVVMTSPNEIIIRKPQMADMDAPMPSWRGTGPAPTGA